MEPRILTSPVARSELAVIAAAGLGDLVKIVVDVERNLLALDAELHADLETLLLDDGSAQADVWGANLYPAEPGEKFLEYDSLINVRPSQGNRSRNVDEPVTRKRIAGVVAAWVVG